MRSPLESVPKSDEANLDYRDDLLKRCRRSGILRRADPAFNPIRDDILGAQQNFENPSAEPPSERAESLRKLWDQNSRAFAGLWFAVGLAASGQNALADDILDELDQEPIRELLGLKQRLEDNGAKSIGWQRFETAKNQLLI
jgi:hypothetical protein